MRRPAKPLTAEQIRQRTQELAAQHHARLEGRDRDYGGPSGFYESSNTRRTKRSGQRGKF